MSESISKYFFLIIGVFGLVVGLLTVSSDGDFGSYFLLIAGTIFTILGVMVLINTSKEENERDILWNHSRINRFIDGWIERNLSKYNIQAKDRINLSTVHSFYCFNAEEMIFAHGVYHGRYDRENDRTIDGIESSIIDLKEVKKISLKTNDKVVGEITKDNAVGRALVGGVLFGGAGAIVASNSASENVTHSNVVTSIELEIITSSVSNPYSTITLYEESYAPNTNLKSLEKEIKNMYWSLENCIQQKSVSQ